MACNIKLFTVLIAGKAGGFEIRVGAFTIKELSF
jgi:hypothetical protein